MTQETDRIPAPTNGRRPHPVQPPPSAPAEPPVVAAAARDLPGGLSPRQLAVGFGVIAWLLVIVAGQARRRLRR